MDVGLAIAGFLCILLAAGHTAIGVRWVLPSVTEDKLPPTPFGSSSMSAGMVRVTWFVVTIFAAGIGALLVTLAWTEDADPRTLLLRWIAVMWVAAAVMAFWVAPVRGRNLRRMMRLPVPFVWLVIAVLCWAAST